MGSGACGSSTNQSAEGCTGRFDDVCGEQQGIGQQGGDQEGGVLMQRWGLKRAEVQRAVGRARKGLEHVRDLATAAYNRELQETRGWT